MDEYRSSHTGREIDDAVEAVGNKASLQDLASLASRVTALENEAYTQTIDATVYAAIRGNVNTLRDKVNDLVSAIGGMANYAFENGRPTIYGVDQFSWPNMSDATPVLTSPGVVINLDPMEINENTISRQVSIKGSNLKRQLHISISGNNGETLSVSPQTVEASQANAGTYITIQYQRHSSERSYGVTGNLFITSDDGINRNTPVYLTVKVDTSPSLVLPSGAIAFGTLASNEQTMTKSVTIQGVNLTKPLTLAITAGGGLTGFSLGSQQVSAEDANAGTNVDITYRRSSTQLNQTVTGKLSITSEDGIDAEFNLSIEVNAQQSYTDPYIQDNLLLHLDGRNMGGENDNKWKDTGGGRNIVFTLSKENTTENNNVASPSVESDSNGTKGVKFSMDGQFAVCSDTDLRDSLNYANCLIEVCFTAGEDFIATGKVRPFFVTNDHNKIACIFGYANQNGYKHFDYRTLLATDSPSNDNSWIVAPASHGSAFNPAEGDLVRISMCQHVLMVNGAFFSDIDDPEIINETIYISKNTDNIKPLAASGTPALPILIGGRRTVDNNSIYHRAAFATIHEVRIYDITGMAVKGDNGIIALMRNNQAEDLRRYGSGNS